MSGRDLSPSSYTSVTVPRPVCEMEDIDAYPIPGFREPVSCLTHLFAALVFAVLSYHLVQRGRGGWVRTASLTIMATSSVFLLSMRGLISCVLLWKRFGSSFVKPLLGGGIACTLGAIVLDLNWPTLIQGVVVAHELWHVAVLVGLGLHWKFAFQFADGRPDATPQ